MKSTAAELVGSSRRSVGWTTRQLAEAVGGSQPSLVDVERGRKDASIGRSQRLLAAMGWQLTALPTRLTTVIAAAEAVRSYLGQDDRASALRMVRQLAADLGRADPALRVALTVAPPASTGDERFDALIAGVAEVSLQPDGLPLPRWLSDGSRTLLNTWDVEEVPALQETARSSTPPALARRGVFIAADELVDR